MAPAPANKMTAAALPHVAPDVPKSLVLDAVRAHLSKYDVRGPIIVGVSGGADSLALAWALHQIGLEHGDIQPRALIIDHALQTNSAAVADQAAAACARLGIAQHMQRLTWPTGVPTTAMQAAARRARHVALGQAAITANCQHVFLAHHGDDQCENMVMGAARGQYGRIMRAHRITPFWAECGEIYVHRPLLGLRKNVLMACLTALGVAWYEDRANRNAAFERVRTRQQLAANGLAGDNICARLLALAAQFQALDETWRRMLRHAANALRVDGGAIVLDGAHLPIAIQQELLGVAIAAIGLHKPAPRQLEHAVANLREGPAVKVSLAGCLVAATPTHWQISAAPPRRHGARKDGPRDCGLSLTQRLALLLCQ